MEFISFAKPEIRDEEIQEVIDTIKSGWLTSGPKTVKFEELFREKLKSPYAIALNSATAGLHLSLEAINLKADEYVITSPYTFNSSAAVIRYLGAHPIFVDIDPLTFNIDPKKIQQCLEDHPKKEKIRAIIAVHIAGQSCEMNEIMAIAKKYNLTVIEDAAHALPTTYQGRDIGTIGDIGVFSFYATKTLCTGEGGMVLTSCEKLAKKIRSQRLHGFAQIAWDRYSTSRERSWEYEINELGFKYNMTDIAASLGIHQLAKMGEFYEKRAKIARTYDESFKGLSNIKVPHRKNPSDIHAYHLYIIQVNEENRDRFIEKLREKNIGTSVHFIPLHLFKFWKDQYGFSPNDFPNAFQCFKQAISIPIYTKLSESQVQYICESVKEVAHSL